MKTKNIKIVVISVFIISLLAIGLAFVAFSKIISTDDNAGASSSNIALQTLTNLGLSVNTTNTPDFSTCSGSSCIKFDLYTGDIEKNQGDGTNGIYSASDDLGISYYFRGAITNNYVLFANKIWRIVRINGDGTIRIALNESAGTTIYNTNDDDNAYVGYMYGTAGTSTYDDTHSNTNDSTIKTFLDNWYYTNLIEYDSFIVDSIFCNDRSVDSAILYAGTDDEMTLNGNGIGTSDTAYSALIRIGLDFTPSLVCPQDNDKFTVDSTLGNGKLTYPIGLLTADEYQMAGAGTYNYSISTLYAWESNSNAFYLFDSDNDYWTMTPFVFTGNAIISNLSSGCVFGDGNITNNFAVRPVISIKSDAITGGTGTSSDPFVIE